jgi:RimJ/RimL family protein N-acetyltransferase
MSRQDGRVTRPIAELDWPVRTERLSIRPAVAADTTAMYAYRSLPAVAQWLTTFPADRAVWEPHFAERLGSQRVVELDGVLIGDLQLDVGDPWSQLEVREQAVGTMAEIGYVFDPAYVGRGYATEAVQALLGIAFDGVGVRRVIAQCFADNEASWRLMERVGMRREQHTKQDSLHRSGEWLDGMMYALLADEWRSARELVE